MYEVTVGARSIEPFAELVGGKRVADLQRQAAIIRAGLGTRAIWNINSTAAGGGVAEMLRSVLRYARGLGVAARWLVVEGPPEFFALTKHLHNALHGVPGASAALGPRELYERVMRANIIALDTLVRPGDVVICHDPETAGLIPHLLRRGAAVVWRCHIGHERHDGEVDRGWAFLRPYLEATPIAVFSRRAYAPAWLAAEQTAVLQPSIDPFSTKNQPLTDETVRAILVEVGLVNGPPGSGAPVFRRDDGSAGRIDHQAEVIRLGRPPSWAAPLVVQISRWDVSKDPAGVLEGFARFVESEPADGVQLVLAGPAVGAVADDPEAAEVLAALAQRWRALPESLRRAVHLAALPMEDSEENGAIVNALQRHAAVIVQKSLHEGFGLTVTEALWKRRPVVASAVGGISDQIRDGIDGLLIHDPADVAEFAATIARPLADPELAQRLGNAGQARVREEYLSVAALERWAELVLRFVAAGTLNLRPGSGAAGSSASGEGAGWG